VRLGNQAAHCDGGDNHVDHKRIELRAAVLLELLQHYIRLKALAVRAVCRHRVDSIGNENDACADRNCLARQALRITPAIPSFMMGPHRILNEAPELRDDAHQVGAAGGMSLHQCSLGFGEPGVLP